MVENTRIQYLYRSDRFGNPLGRLGYVSEATRDRKTDGTNTLDVTCKTEVQKGDRIFFEDIRGIAHEYEISDLTYSRKDSLTMSFHATDSISELGVWFIEDKRNRDKPASECLRKALEGTRWQVGTVEQGDVETADLAYYHTTGLAAVQSVAETFGLEIVTHVTLNPENNRVTQRFIDLVKAQGSRNPRRFDFGRNLSGITRKIDPSAVVTRLYPYGKGLPEQNEAGEETGGYGRKIDISSVNNGKPYIEDTDATLLWGVPDASGQLQPAMGTLDYSEVEEPAELLRLAKLDLEKLKQPRVSYTADVVHLGIEGQDRGAVGLGDTVQVVDTSFPVAVRVTGRVLEIKDDLLNPLSDKTTITLGNLVDGYIKSQQATANQVAKLWQGFGAWNNAAGLTPSYIDGIINGWNVEMNHTGGYVYCVPGEGIYVFDKPRDQNPTMAIQIGGGYFRIANSKNSDGTWNWRTMGNGNGLVADVLYTGTIKGGSNTWNLDTGDLLFQRGLIHDAANKNVWDLTNSTLKTNAMVAIDSVLTGEFTSDSDSGDVHILNGVMDVLHDINDESKGVLRFQSGSPMGSKDVFSIFSQGQTDDMDIFTYGGGALTLGAGSGSSFNSYIKFDGSDISFSTIPEFPDGYSGSASIAGATLQFENGICTSASSSSGYSGSINAGSSTISVSDGVITDVSGGGDGKSGDFYVFNKHIYVEGGIVTEIENNFGGEIDVNNTLNMDRVNATSGGIGNIDITHDEIASSSGHIEFPSNVQFSGSIYSIEGNTIRVGYTGTLNGYHFSNGLCYGYDAS